MESFLIQSKMLKKSKAIFLAAALLVYTQNILCILPEGQTDKSVVSGESIFNKNGMNLTKIYEHIINAVKTAASLNYFKDTGIILDFGENKVALDWGFAGSGDIFRPLETIKPDLKNSASSNGKLSAITVIQTLALKQLQSLATNQLQRRGEKNEFLKWLSSFKLTPLHLFGLKLIMLIRSIDIEQDASYLFEEIACLLFRLSLVDDLSIIDKSRPLTSFLPESLNDLLKGVGFGISEFVDQVWSTIVCNKAMPTELSLKKPVTVHGFVFANQSLAQEAYAHFKDYAKTTFCEDFEAFGMGRGQDLPKFQVVDMSTFKKVGREVTVEDLSKVNPFTDRQVGYREFNLDNNVIVCTSLECEILRQIKLLGNKDGVIYFEDKDQKEFWVAQVSQNIEAIAVVKSLLLTFTRTFKEYVNIKKSLYEGSDQPSCDYRALVNKRENLRKNLESFVRTVDGKAVFEDIRKQINSVVNSGLTEKDKKELESRKSTLEKELRSLEAQRIRNEKICKSIEIEAYSSSDKNKNLLVQKANKLKLDIETISAKIDAKQKEVQGLSEKLRSKLSTQDAATLKDKQKLERLNKIVQERKAVNGFVDPIVLKKIEELEQKILNSTKSKQSKIMLEDMLVVREKVAQIFKEKAVELNKKLQQKQVSLENIEDADEKMIQELLLEDFELLTKAFISRLGDSAKEIRLNNDKAKKLQELRTISESKNLSTTETRQLNILELEVGYILDGRSHENFINNLMMRSSIFSEFVKDIIGADDSDVKFIGLKQRIVESVKQIVDGSGLVQDNVIVLKYLTQFMPGSFKAFLRISGVGQFIGV